MCIRDRTQSPWGRNILYKEKYNTNPDNPVMNTNGMLLGAAARNNKLYSKKTQPQYPAPSSMDIEPEALNSTAATNSNFSQLKSSSASRIQMLEESKNSVHSMQFPVPQPSKSSMDEEQSIFSSLDKPKLNSEPKGDGRISANSLEISGKKDFIEKNLLLVYWGDLTSATNQGFDICTQSHITLRMIKSRNPKLVGTEFLINEHGAYPKQRTTAAEGVIIGRRGPSAAFKGVLHDIELDEQDDAVDDMHAWIRQDKMFLPAYNSGVWSIMLMAAYGRRYNHFLARVPMDIIKYIISFVPRHQKTMTIQDMQTKDGTFVKIPNNGPTGYQLEKDDNVMLAFHSSLWVMEVEDGRERQSAPLKFDPVIFGNFLKKHSIVERRLRLDEKAHWPEFMRRYEEYEHQVGTNEVMVSEEFAVNYVLFKFTEKRALNARDFEILWEPKSLSAWKCFPAYKVYNFGRSSVADYMFDASPFSRQQARLGFNDRSQRWEVFDGNEEKGSANGTWRDLRRGEMKERCDQIELKVGDEVKIGNAIVRVDFFNRSRRENLWKYTSVDNFTVRQNFR
eukprot:TRINITY_DN6941_c0_g1_i1.p1 TRINITY_DN6941_c0_g1~~TRINITY_DN6941_c0_g1_i1.p1  ORF type:complete len:563 (-),score=123.60 TRINITY_DN6941_c0_g1_i1:466-2154(-)